MSRWRGLATSACTLASTKTKDSVLPYMSLGLVPYANALRLQDYMVRRRLDINRGVRHDSVRDIVFILEHPPVYTAGKRLKNQEDEGKRLKTLGAEFFETQRGGQLTFHGPGQLVAYPILDIRSYQLNTACYVSHLEQILINVCKSYGIEAQRTQNTGVWVGQDHKIAALGVHLRRYVTSHGIALNCTTDLSWFDNIVACGLSDKYATSLKEQLGCDVPVSEVNTIFCTEFGNTFGRNVVPVQDVQGGHEFVQEVEQILEQVPGSVMDQYADVKLELQ